MSSHEYFMKRALEIAQLGFVSPNPRVGAVLVDNGNIVAEGYHQNYGGAHAEINALQNLPLHYSLDRATLYVSLEPCSHYGKTPPCALKIIESGIKKVVIACLDPNPLVAGKGVVLLKEAGIDVTVGILENEAHKLNEMFFKYITTGLPFVVLKSAMSLDGKICTYTGNSQWISSPSSRAEVHLLRSQVTAVMVGVNTVLADDPKLTSRIEKGRNPQRIILDSSLKTPLSATLVQTASDIPTMILTTIKDSSRYTPYQELGVDVFQLPSKNKRIDLQEMMTFLSTKNIDSILLEAGGELVYSALQEKIVDKLLLYYAPIIIGGRDSKTFVEGEGVSTVGEAFSLRSYQIRFTVQDELSDFVVEAYPQK